MHNRFTQKMKTGRLPPGTKTKSKEQEKGKNAQKNTTTKQKRERRGGGSEKARKRENIEGRGHLFSMEVERLVVNEFLHFQVCVSERDVGCVLGWDRLGESSDKDWHGLGRENIETFESVAFKEVDHVCAETRREHVFGLSFAQFAKLALHRRRRFRHIVGEERAVGDQQSSMDVAHNTHEPWNI